MSDQPEPIDPRTLPLEPVECSLGTWTHSDVDDHGNVYLITRPDGQVWGIRAKGDLSAEAIEDDIANPGTLPPSVPQEVTRPRFIIALRKVLGLTEDAVYDMISGLPAEQQDDVRDWFDHGVFFNRADSLLNDIAASQGITAEQLDSVFIHAGTQT